MSTLRSHRIDADGVALHVEERGAGSALLLLHGFTGSAAGSAPIARGLADRHRVLAVDLVGHGRSEAPTDVGAYSMERCTDQLVAVLTAQVAGPAHIVGYSMGGRVALSLLARHPERVRSAVLIGASAGLSDPAARAARIRDDEALALRIEREGVAAFVDHWAALPLFASQARRLPAEVALRLRAQRLSNRAHGLANALRGMGGGAQPPLEAALGDLHRPVLLAVGEDDAKFRGIAARLSARLPDARLATIPEAGHAAHLENPSAFLRIARQFLSAVEARHSAADPPAHPSMEEVL